MDEHPPPQGRPQQPSLPASLFDVEFHHHVTPRVVSVLYVLVLIVAILEAIVLLVAGLSTLLASFNILGILLGLLWLAGAMLVPLITVTLARLVLEFFVVQFHILNAIIDLRR